MMAFFDSLVQREIEGWSSEESVSSEVSANGYGETVQDVLPSASSDSESVRSDSRVTELQALAAAYVEALEGQVNDAPDQSADAEQSQPVEAQNRISQLIARKRAQLMRLARGHSHVSEPAEALRTANKKHKVRMLMIGSGHITDSSDSGRDISVSIQDTTDSEDDVLNDKAKKRFSGIVKKENVTEHQNGKTSASTSKTLKKSETKSSTENRKRRMRYMLAFSESSDDEVGWKPSPKRRKLWNEAKTSKAKSSDSDAVSAPEVSGDDVRRASEPHLNGGNENCQSKLTKKVKRLRKRRGKQNESENGTVLEDSDSNTSSDSTLCRKKKSERRISSYHDRHAQASSRSKSVKNSTVGKWNGKHKCDGVEKTMIETSSSSSDNDQENCSHKIPKTDRDKVPNSTNPEALAKLKVSYARSFHCNKSVTKDKCDNSHSNNNNNEYVNGSETVISPGLPSPVTPNMNQYSQSVPDMETPDSGIIMAQCSSAGSLESRTAFSSRPGSSTGTLNSPHVIATDNDGSDDPDWVIFKRFKSRLDRTRRNYRNHIGDTDSDSN